MDSDKIIMWVIKQTIFDKIKSFFSSTTYASRIEVTDISQIPPEIRNIFCSDFGDRK